MPKEIQATKFKLTNPPTSAPCDIESSEKETRRDASVALQYLDRKQARKTFARRLRYVTAEFASGKNMPSVKIPSNGPAVMPDKLLPA